MKILSDPHEDVELVIVKPLNTLILYCKENYFTPQYLNANKVMTDKEKAKAYWKENIRYVLILMFIWFIVSFGAGILFKDALNELKMGGFKLGFWFAQQGSMYVFVVLIFVYVLLMNKLDKKYGYDAQFIN